MDMYQFAKAEIEKRIQSLGWILEHSGGFRSEHANIAYYKMLELQSLLSFLEAHESMEVL